ncbi:hypothetical protein K466DRAFT_587857 [Polyporus arcularius HHB13444]|uniref:Uncharacterized protein n=1 Tax=Polyporus arcularius HHB13444 TaxID=1314778 RepID=A0A5C3PAT7_9APHY|nr:hypothetical protein K466DRAFT_587857 [Polyporus arcularius HHB13444]
MPPIHLLPVELLTRIFHLGVDSDPLPDDRPPEHRPFEVLVSHVCRHWRHIALHTPHLWTTVHFRLKSHIDRGRAYLSRNARLPIDIYVDTCAEDTAKHRKDLIFRDSFMPTFDVVLPHIDRWREFHLKVADLECKGSARKVLNTCGPAPLLRTLQLWHVQNWESPERLFGAIGPPPVVVFGGHLPRLKNIILQGVNLPWTSSPFLSNLTAIEYALHSDDVRMPWEQWRNMLVSSPNLERLCLHYSGPRAKSSGGSPPDGIEWWGADPPAPDDVIPPGVQLPPAADPVLLPRLQEIQLHDLDSDYLIALFRTLDAPHLRALHLELDTEDQDFTPFVQYLVAPPLALVKSRHHHHHANGDAHEGPSSLHRNASRPKFPHLKSLTVSALTCSLESWRALLESAPELTRLEADFMGTPEGAFDVLFESTRAVPPSHSRSRSPSPDLVSASSPASSSSAHVRVNGVVNGVNGIDLKGKGKGKGKARAVDEEDYYDYDHAPAYHAPPDGETPVLPVLRTLRAAGVSGKQLARLAAHRRARGCPVRRWEVEDGARDEEGVALERELVAVSARWRAGVVERERVRGGGEGGEGKVREPWRLDEDVERLVWYREELVPEYDEDEGVGAEGDADASEDGDGGGDGEAGS